MSGLDGVETAPGPGSARSVVRFALAASPLVFTASNFATRIAQHALFYGIFLAAALTACLFFAAPLEATGLSLACILVLAAIGSLVATSGARLRRALQGGIVATYARGAGMLFKAITELWHRF